MQGLHSSAQIPPLSTSPEARWRPARDRADVEKGRCFTKSGFSCSIAEYVSTEVLPIGIDLTASQHRAVMDQYARILAGGRNFQVNHRHGWIFPDGHFYPLPYFVFSSGRTFGLVRISHGCLSDLIYNIPPTPYCVIELVQGIKGADTRDLPMQNGGNLEMVRHILKASGELVRTGWKIALLRSVENERLRDSYFEKEIISSEKYFPRQWATVHGRRNFFPLRDPVEDRVVRRILGLERCGPPHPQVKPMSK